MSSWKSRKISTHDDTVRSINTLLESYRYGVSLQIDYLKMASEEKKIGNYAIFSRQFFIEQSAPTFIDNLFKSWGKVLHQRKKATSFILRTDLKKVGMLKLLKPWYEKEGIPLPRIAKELTNVLLARLFGETPDFEKRIIEEENMRKIEESNENQVIELCRIVVPLDVMNIVFSYCKKGRSFYNSVASVCQSFYVFAMMNWGSIRLSKRNINSVPRPVIRYAKRIDFVTNGLRSRVMYEKILLAIATLRELNFINEVNEKVFFNLLKKDHVFRSLRVLGITNLYGMKINPKNFPNVHELRLVYFEKKEHSEIYKGTKGYKKKSPKMRKLTPLPNFTKKFLTDNVKIIKFLDIPRKKEEEQDSGNRYRGFPKYDRYEDLSQIFPEYLLEMKKIQEIAFNVSSWKTDSVSDKNWMILFKLPVKEQITTLSVGTDDYFGDCVVKVQALIKKFPNLEKVSFIFKSEMGAHEDIDGDYYCTTSSKKLQIALDAIFGVVNVEVVSIKLEYFVQDMKSSGNDSPPSMHEILFHPMNEDAECEEYRDEKVDKYKKKFKICKQVVLNQKSQYEVANVLNKRDRVEDGIMYEYEVVMKRM